MDPAGLTFALLAGAVAAFNPCGFALLPAYLGLLVSGGPGEGAPARTLAAVQRAARFAAGMTVGFVAVFGLFGAVVTSLAVSVQRYLPVVTVVIGVLLVALGGWLLTGRALAIPGLAGRGSAPTASWFSQVGYGVSFALASLSCTVAPFLAVTTSSLSSGGAFGVLATFVSYALGMGAVVLALALAAATASTSVIAGMRRAGPVITRFSGLLLVAAGAYVAWYGWFEIRVLAGTATADPVVSAAVTVQSAISRFVAGLGAGTLLGMGVLLVLAVAGALLARRRSVKVGQ